ncbi:MAG TPA: NF038122 family metalloprotease [Candidatus Angelobacter sp.]|nr:NF038122 family metalloprotease [Candidatus Angelobacter sp.]
MSIPRVPGRIFLITVLWLAIFCGLGIPAKALTIIPSFDISITGDPNATAMEAAINAAIQVFETNIADNATINITFKSDSSVGLAESLVYYVTVNYSDYVNALIANAKSSNDFLALSQLPNTVNEPVTGQSQMVISEVLAIQLGLVSPSSDVDSILLNTTIMSFTRPPPNDINTYDMQSAVEHEIDEVMGGGGAGCNLTASSMIGATDLFRYATNGTGSTLARSWTTSNGDNAFFSVDGTNLWFRFNTDAGGDYGDFWGIQQDPITLLPVYWSPPGITPHAEVQNAFGTPGYFSYPANFPGNYSENTSPDLGTNELTMMDVIGWTLITHLPPPMLTMATGGSHKLAVSWPASYAGFTLQERTNLMSGSWITSATGTNNPAVITNNVTHKYYRLYQAAVPAVAAAIPATSQAPAATARDFRILKFQP